MGYLTGVSRAFLDVLGVVAFIKSCAVCQSHAPGLLFVSSYDVVRKITILRITSFVEMNGYAVVLNRIYNNYKIYIL